MGASTSYSTTMAGDEIPDKQMSWGDSVSTAAKAMMGVPTNLVGRALGVPSYQSQAAPTAAATSANAAAVKASGGDVDEMNGQARGTPATPQATANYSAATQKQTDVWNQLANMGVADPKAAMSGPMPTWDKAGGVAAIAAGGAPRQLNYGPDNVIIGSGKGVGGKFNSFTGIGTPTAGGGSAGGTASPVDVARGHINDLLARADTFSKSGTLSGKVMAAGLYRRAAALAPMLGVETSSAHAMGQLNLDTQKAWPGMQLDLAGLEAATKGDSAAMGRIQAARQGSVYGAPTYHQGPLGSMKVDPATGETTHYDMYGNPTGTSGPGTPLPSMKPAPQQLPGR